MNAKKLGKDLIIIFGLLLLFYVISMSLAFLIPDGLLMEKWQESVNVISGEGKRWMVIPGNEATKLDTFTDNLMFQRLRNRDGLNPLQAAMWNDGYYRYWMGIQIILRPLLIVLNYSGIRYLNIFFVLGLLSFTFSAISRSLGKKIAAVFLVSLAMVNVWIFPLSMQYTSAYAVMMIAILCLCVCFKKGLLKDNQDVLFFFVIGSFTNFFDLLTVPLLTFGMPFVVYFALVNKQTIRSFVSNFLLLLKTGLAWLFGYVLTWTAKWAIGSIVLKENIFVSAIRQILFRTAGNEEYPLAPEETMRNLINLMFPSYALKIIGLLLVLWLIVFIFYKKPWKQIVSCLPLLLVALLPYVWFVILLNHNQHHYYFTYRIQAMTVFSVCVFLIFSIDWPRINRDIKEKIANRRSKKKAV